MQSPLYADLVLLLEIAVGLVLLGGAWLARKRKFREHACCQCVAVLINLVIIAVVMVPSFREHVAPRIPAKEVTLPWLQRTQPSVELWSLQLCIFSWLLGRSCFPRCFASSATNCGCERCWRFGGWFSCWELPLTCAGMSHFHFDTEEILARMRRPPRFSAYSKEWLINYP
jgi:hypothetical protein